MPKNESLYERLRHYEWSKTEPETLTGLVQEAIDMGGKAQEEQAQLRNASEKVFALLSKSGLIFEIDYVDSEKWLAQCTVGLDGSHQLVGGIGGQWYVPISCALVIFENGLSGKIEVKVDAHIVPIQETEFTRVGSLASERMLEVETKAIFEWAKRNRESLLFIDGPIVDPPTCMKKDYVSHRCNGIKECLKRGVLVIGCAKRVRESHFKKWVLEQTPDTEKYKTHIKAFPSDLQLLAYTFGRYWQGKEALGGSVASVPIDSSEATNVYKLYREQGIYVFSTFVQKGRRYYLLRLDVPFLAEEARSKEYVDKRMREAIDATLAWTYPEHTIPLPIFLADHKCEVRKGCAEVLYQEILTKSRTTDPFDHIVTLQLEARL